MKKNSGTPMYGESETFAWLLRDLEKQKQKQNKNENSDYVSIMVKM